MMFTLAVAGSGMSFAIPQMPLERISVEADSLVGVTLADIDEIATDSKLPAATAAVCR